MPRLGEHPPPTRPRLRRRPPDRAGSSPVRCGFEGGIGPLTLAEEASDIARVGCSANVVLARTRGRWEVLEVGNVYP
jgi:hypothetical protein